MEQSLKKLLCLKLCSHLSLLFFGSIALFMFLLLVCLETSLFLASGQSCYVSVQSFTESLCVSETESSGC